VDLVDIMLRLRRDVGRLRFAPPVDCVYNPLVYAWAAHETYLRRFGGDTGRLVLLGMNPGPFGMAQTGVPFGEVSFVREWMGIDVRIGKPECEHPKRPIDGFACTRSEVSGARLWGWARDRFGTAERFFARFFVLNYCPLVFMEESGRNRTPDKLPAAERDALYAVCDRALDDALRVLAPRAVVGVGNFAARRAGLVVGERDLPVGQILHPSPASPKANRGWAESVEASLAILCPDVTRGW
jgi:single-strand selective monofunctional uracil DNA glycosylase